MLLAMVEDIRVVLLRVASRTQTLRYFTDHPGVIREPGPQTLIDQFPHPCPRLVTASGLELTAPLHRGTIIFNGIPEFGDPLHL